MSEVESAKIITVSTAHLHPQTIERICARSVAGAPSIAIRDEGLLVNSHLDGETRDATQIADSDLAREAPDLVVAMAFARGQGAAWVSFDRDGDVIDQLPSYDEGERFPPRDPAWGVLARDEARADGGDPLESDRFPASPEAIAFAAAGGPEPVADHPDGP